MAMPYYGYYGHPGPYLPGYTGLHALPLSSGLVAHPNGAVTPPLTPSVAAATHAHLATKFGR